MNMRTETRETSFTVVDCDFCGAEDAYPAGLRQTIFVEIPTTKDGRELFACSDCADNIKFKVCDAF